MKTHHKRPNKRWATPPPFEIIRDVLHYFQLAFGAASDFEGTELEAITWQAQCAVEDLFCRLDWRAYRTWAIAEGCSEPCDAWYEIEDKEAIWPDETAFVTHSVTHAVTHGSRENKESS